MKLPDGNLILDVALQIFRDLGIAVGGGLIVIYGFSLQEGNINAYIYLLFMVLFVIIMAEIGIYAVKKELQKK